MVYLIFFRRVLKKSSESSTFSRACLLLGSSESFFWKFINSASLRWPKHSFFSNPIFVWEKNRLDSSLSQLRLPRRPLLLLLVINPQSKSSSKSLAVNEVEFLAHNYRLLLIGSRSILRHTWLRQFFLHHQLNWIGWCYASALQISNGFFCLILCKIQIRFMLHKVWTSNTLYNK